MIVLLNIVTHGDSFAGQKSSEPETSITITLKYHCSVAFLSDATYTGLFGFTDSNAKTLT